MSKELKTINVSELCQTKATNTIHQHQLAIIIRNGTPIGFATDTKTAQKLINQRIWNTEDYGVPCKGISADTFGKKRFFIPTRQQASTNVACFSTDFIDDNWEKIQLNFSIENVEALAKIFHKDLFPHIKVRANNCKAIEYSNELQEFYCHHNSIVNPHITYEELAQEVDRLNKPIYFTKQTSTRGHSTPKPHAIIFPASTRPLFEQEGIDVETNSFRNFFSQGHDHISEGQVLELKYLKGGGDGSIIVVNKEPSRPIEHIIDSAYPLAEISLTQTRDLPPLVANYDLTKLEVGAIISAQIIQASLLGKAISKRIHTPTVGEQYITATGNPKTIELLQRLPLSSPITIKSNNNPRSFLQEAFTQEAWLKDPLWQDRILIKGEKRRKQFQDKIHNTLTQLFHQNDGHNLILVENEQGDVKLAITGSQEIARDMYTIERHLGIR
ncbi:MAG: hypothetical protein ACPG05_02095 [Bdellovibrionales bacterium]